MTQLTLNVNNKKETLMKIQMPDIEQMRYDMCVLHRPNEMWSKFRESYKTYMGAKHVSKHLSSDNLTDCPDFFLKLHESQEAAFLDMYKVWLDVTRYPRNKMGRV